MTDFEGRSRLVRQLNRVLNASKPQVHAIAHQIYENPEPPLAENTAAAAMIEFLQSHGFKVERGIAGLETAFVATFQHFDPEQMRKGLRHGSVGVIAEYDAGSAGHLHGRHLTAAGALAVAIATKRVLADVHGELRFIGCPAASNNEGKRILAEAGVFDPSDLLVALRPVSSGFGFQPTTMSSGSSLGTARIGVRFAGDAGEADARQRLATAIDSQDHELGAYERIQIALIEAGAEITVESDTNGGLNRLIGRAEDLANEAARETNSIAVIEQTAKIPAGNVNRILARRIKTYVDAAKLEQDAIVKTAPTQPDDIAYAAIIAGTTACSFPISREPVEIGTEAFAEASISEYAFEQLDKAANGVAVTLLDALGDLELRGFVEGELIRGLTGQGIRREPRRWLGMHPVIPKNGQGGPAALPPAGSPKRG